MNLTKAWKLTGALLSFAVTTAGAGGVSHNTLTAIGDKTVCPGSTVTFTTTAGGPTPYKFSWYKNSTLIPNQTTDNLTLANVSSSDAATYSVVLKGGANSVTNKGTLTIATSISATLLPNLLRYVGSIAVFSTTPSGGGPYTFTWQKNGTNINGQTASSLVLSNLTIADSATYKVIVTGACGNTVTETGTLVVDTCFPAVDVMLVIDRSASMTGKPYFDALAACSNFVQNLHYTNGDQAGLVSYNSSATLDQMLTNSLSKLDKAIGSVPGAGGFTSISLGLQTSQNELASVRHDSGSLPVLVLLSDGMPTGSDNSSNALYWATQSKIAGTRIFTVGLGSVNAGLLRGIASATSDYYFTTNSSELKGLFNAISTVICRPPTNIVVTGPANLTVCAGSTANFSVTAAGCDSFRYQWFKGTSILAGRTNNVLTLSNVSASDAGIYSVAVLSDCQNVTNSAMLTVNAATVVTVPPSDATNCPGQTVGFSVNATGTGLTYQWYKGSSLLSGQAGSTLTLNNISAADAGIYSVVVSGTCSNPVTNSAVLVVNSTVTVATPPNDTTVCAGMTASFAVNATGMGLTYQWYKGTSLLDGKTGSTLTLNGVSTADAGVYSVVISSVCGAPVTNSATLSVNASMIVSVPPSNATNCPGTTANFSVNATGTGLAFQWYKGTSLLSGKTSSTLVLNSVSAADAGVYNVVISGACGVPVTNSATLFVNANTIITMPPSNATNCSGTTANFTVNATGTGLTYQWYKFAVGPLSGQTNSTLSLPNVIPPDTGTYTVVVSGICGLPVTNSAVLMVYSNTIVLQPPQDVTVCPGMTANFTVGATGTDFTYQWYNSAGLLSGQTHSTLSLTNVSAADAGVYRVVVSGVCGVPTTNSATLFVNANTVISVPPSNATNCPGTTANFSVNATGAGLTYQWYKSTGPLSDQTNNTLSLASVSAANAGVYSVVISGACGVPVTNSATLFVNANTIITMPPSNATNCAGTTANFSVNATGVGLTYQWYKFAVGPLSGQTNSTLSLPNVIPPDSGTYIVVVSGVCGLPMTNSAVLMVYSNTIVLQPPQDVTVCPGMTANFTVGATGTDFTYQWYNSAGLLNGQTRSTLSLRNVSAADAGVYRVVVSGVCGGSTTNSATLFVNANTIITMPPSNATNCSGTTANFSVNATGAGLTYQWYKSTGPLSGQTNSTLSLASVSAANAGVYSVVISGTCGVPVTNSATLFVNGNTIITMPPSNTTNCSGTTANFSVNATGVGLTYQWYKFAVGPLSGQTNSTLSLPNVIPPDSGTYTVVVSGICGLPVTNSAVLMVYSNTIVLQPPQDVTVCPGMTANFTVGATGTDFTYQWYSSTGPLSGQTNRTLSLTNVSATDAGVYRVVVSGVCGAPTTNSATLFVNANLVITAPLSRFETNCPGTAAFFALNATGSGLSYQWYFNPGALSGSGLLLTGETNNILVLSNLTFNSAGFYAVVVSGACGTPVTNSSFLFVTSPGSVITPPSNVTNCPGTTANFSVNATGEVTFQWYKGTSLLSGKTSSALVLNNVSAADAGIYSVVITGDCSAAVTNSATLFVNANAIITMPPSNTTNCSGTTANFSVNASGTGLTYQWYKGATLLGGHTTNVLTLNNVSAADAGTYSVVVSGVCGVPTTNSAMLFVNANTIITMPPANTTNCPGTTANFSVNATGSGLTYQWYRGVAPLSGRTDSTLALPHVTSADAGIYSVVVSGACGTPVTNSATLFVNENTVVVYGASTNETVCPGMTVNFFEYATGTDLAYQWYKGTTPLVGQTTNFLTLTNVSASDVGTYNLVISGACGAPVTNSATLFVNAVTIVTTPPANTTVCPGMTANFIVNATGSGLTYQWYNATGALAGQTGSTLSMPAVSASDAGVYTVVVGGACGAPVTLSAVLTVNQNVSVAALANVTNNIGSSVTFTAVVSGTGPFGYQWSKGSTALAGQTNSTLTLSNLQPQDGGMYSVSVSGACGHAVTTAAVLTINLPPTAVIVYPTNGAVFVEPATFTVLAGASDPDGVVTNVEIFSSTNGTDFVLLGETNYPPYLTIASNLPAGHYTFVARATDNWGATGDSAPVSVDVVPVTPPDIFTVGAITLNTQDGFQWLTNVACNPLYSHANALRIDIHNITNSTIRVVNASGTNNGVPFVISPGAIQPGTCWTNVIKFYDPQGIAFFPILTVQLADPIGVGEPDGTPQAIFSGKFLRDGTFLVEFATVPGITYYVQYSSDMVHWKTVLPPFAGTGQHLQWIDSGPPETESLPSTKTTRFYRVLLAN